MQKARESRRFHQGAIAAAFPRIAQRIILECMSQRKRKHHKCIHHPKVRARKKCERCGAWMCSECMIADGEHHLCPSCRQAQQNQSPDQCAEPAAESAPEPVRRGARALFIAALAGVVFGLSGIAFGLIELRESSALRKQNAALQQNRMQLIRLVKQKHARLTKLEGAMREASAKANPVDSTRIEIAPNRPARAPVRSSIAPVAPFKTMPVTFDQGVTSKRLVSITFDGGSHANAAHDILDTLRSRKVKATMFLTGRFISRYPDLVKKMVAERHELGNHTDSHPHLTAWETERNHRTLPNITSKFIGEQLSRANARLKAVTGTEFAPIWRAPYGEKNAQICRWALHHGYLHIGWRQARTWRKNLDSNDWIPDKNTPGYHSPDEVLEKFLTLAKSKPYGIHGGIILMHLGTERKKPEQQVHRILGALIDELRELGYESVPISVLLNESGIDPDQIRPAARIAAETPIKRSADN